MIKPVLVKIKKHAKSMGIIAVGVFFSLYIFSLTKNFLKLSSSDGKIEEAKLDLEAAKAEQQNLIKNLEKISSAEYKEIEAREKLGLVKKGEIVVILPDVDTLKKLSPRRAEEKKVDLPISNWKKWMDVFFDF